MRKAIQGGKKGFKIILCIDFILYTLDQNVSGFLWSFSTFSAEKLTIEAFPEHISLVLVSFI